MAVNLTSIFDSVSENSGSGNEESVRSIVNSPLASGVPTGIGTSLIGNNQSQNQTSRLFSGSDASITGASQGDRAQVPPATDNKVPRIYGKITTGGVVTDVYKEDANTIWICYTLSETNVAGNDKYITTNALPQPPYDPYLEPAWDFVADECYRNNQRIQFSGAGGAANSKAITLFDIDDANSNYSISAANVINVWAWGGNVEARCQMWPVRGNQITSSDARNIFPTWTNSNTMINTVFAIVKIDRLNEDFDATANVEIDDVGEFRFTIATKGFANVSSGAPASASKLLNNPAHALQDYLEDSVYGCGLTTADLDIPAFEAWATYCDQSVPYAEPVPLGWQEEIGKKRSVNAFINAQVPVLQNIEQITQAGDATLHYDTKQGKFTVLVNRAITDAEIAGAFAFNATNIISSINVNSTDLYSLYNFSEVSFPNELQQDRTDNLIVQIPTADRVANEPTSGTNYSIPAINNRWQASDIANISLKQSRINNTISFSSDYSSMGVAVGDFVSVTDLNKGFVDKIVKVMRVNEREQDDGMIVFDYVTIDYSDEPFVEYIYPNSVDDPTGGSIASRENGLNSDLGNTDYFTTFTPGLGDIYVVNETGSGLGNIYNSAGVLIQGNANALSMYSTVTSSSGNNPSGGGVVYTSPWIAVRGIMDSGNANPITSDWDYQQVTLTNAGDGSTLRTDWELGPVDPNVWAWIPLDKATPGNYNLQLVYERDGRIPARLSLPAITGNVSITDLDCHTPNVVTLADTVYGAGSRLWEDFDFFQDGTDKINYTNFYKRQFDVTAIRQSSEFTFDYNLKVDWLSNSNNSDLGVRPSTSITFQNVYQREPAGSLPWPNQPATFTLPMNELGLIASDFGGGDITAVKGVWSNTSTTISTLPSDYGLDSSWYPARINIEMEAQYRDLINPNFAGEFKFTSIPHNYRYKL